MAETNPPLMSRRPLAGFLFDNLMADLTMDDGHLPVKGTVVYGLGLSLLESLFEYGAIPQASDFQIDHCTSMW